MQIQLKVVLLTGLTVICAVGLLTWRAGEIVRADGAKIVNEAAERQLAPVRRLVGAKLETAREQLMAFARSKERGSNQPSFGDFDVVALALENDVKAWTPKWIEKRADAKAARWGGSKEGVFVRSLPFAKVKDGEMYWVWRLDKKEGAIYAVMVSVQVEPPATPAMTGGLPDATTTAAAGGPKRGVVVGFFTGNPLAAVAEDFIGSTHSVYILDDLGYVASHTAKAYNGTRFSEDEIYNAIKKAERAAGAGEYETLESVKVTGRWEKVERTNLYAVITTPVVAAGALAKGLTSSLALFGILVAALSLAAAWAMGGRIASALRDVQRFALEWKIGNYQTGFLHPMRLDEIGDVSRALAQLDPNAVSMSPPVADGVKPAADAQARTAALAPAAKGAPADTEAAYRQMAMGLTSSMRDPIAAILGNIQLLSAKATGADVGEYAGAIEREARRLRGVLDSLTRVAGDDDVKLKPVSLLETVEMAIAAVDKEFRQNGVKLELQLADVPQINANPLHLQAAIEALLRQGIEAMRTRPSKRLAVALSAASDGKARLIIRDTGLGLDREQIARYFEPFHQPYEGARAADLSLAMARATLERHLADIDVDSSPGQGTSVRVEFPPTTRPRDAKLAAIAPTDAAFAADKVVKPLSSPGPELTARVSVNPMMPPVNAKIAEAPSARSVPRAPPLPDLFADMTSAAPPPVESNEPSISFLGGKTPLSVGSSFPPPPPDENSAPLDLSRTAPPKPGESMEVAMPSIDIPPDVEVVIPSSPGKVLQMPARATSSAFDEPSEFEAGSSSSIANLSFDEPVIFEGGDSVVNVSMDDASAASAAQAASTASGPVEPEAQMPSFSSSSSAINLGPGPSDTGGSGLLNIDIPSSFLDDEPDSFRPVALGQPPSSSSPSSVPPLVPSLAPSNDNDSAASSPPRRVPPEESEMLVGASQADDPSGGGFRVKIRRPKAKG